jgi:hypothetical protein
MALHTFLIQIRQLIAEDQLRTALEQLRILLGE